MGRQKAPWVMLLWVCAACAEDQNSESEPVGTDADTLPVRDSEKETTPDRVDTDTDVSRATDSIPVTIEDSEAAGGSDGDTESAGGPRDPDTGAVEPSSDDTAAPPDSASEPCPGCPLDSESEAGTGADTGTGPGDSDDTASASEGPDTAADTESDSAEGWPARIPAEAITVELDPYGSAPLSAVVIVSDDRLTSRHITEVTVTVADRDGGEAYVGGYEPGSDAFRANYEIGELLGEGEVGFPVMGLFEAYENRVSLLVATDAGAFVSDVVIETGRVAAVQGERVFAAVLDADAMTPGWTYLEDRVYDNQGRLRWQGPRIFRLLSDGNILSPEGVWSWLGKPLRRFVFPPHLLPHHDAIELPNGNIAICMDNSETTILNRDGDTVASIEDYVIEIDAVDEIVNAWDLRAFLDVDRCVYAKKRDDWFHLNTLCYDAASDALLLSGRQQGIVSISRGGEQGPEPNLGKSLNWILSPHLDWGLSGPTGEGELDPNDYLLTAVDAHGTPFDSDVQNNLAPPAPDPDAFFWPLGQHGLIITARDADRLSFLTFNNQASYIFGGPGTIDNGITFMWEGDLSDDRADPSFSQIIEYEVDEAAMTVKKLWSFGEHRPELYGSFVSGAALHEETGNRVLLTCGMNMFKPREDPPNPHVIEVTPSGAEVFHLEIENTAEWIFRATGRVDLYRPAP